MSGYQEAMEAAGATVLAFDSFGSYQGDWLAKVVVNGETGFVQGSFGSCSGCDAFEAEFGYSESKCEEHQYDYDDEVTDNCAGCVVARAEHKVKLADFGQNYLNALQTYEEVLKYVTREDWDTESSEMAKWVKDHQ